MHGFAKTLTRMDELDERTARFLGMIEAASGQLADLLDDLALVARIEGGRYDPALREADTIELARAAAARVDDGNVTVAGDGATVETEPDAVSRALSQLARCVVRHGGIPTVALAVDGHAVRALAGAGAGAPDRARRGAARPRCGRRRPGRGRRARRLGRAGRRGARRPALRTDRA